MLLHWASKANWEQNKGILSQLGKTPVRVVWDLEELVNAGGNCRLVIKLDSWNDEVEKLTAAIPRLPQSIEIERIEVWHFHARQEQQLIDALLKRYEIGQVWRILDGNSWYDRMTSEKVEYKEVFG